MASLGPENFMAVEKFELPGYSGVTPDAEDLIIKFDEGSQGLLSIKAGHLVISRAETPHIGIFIPLPDDLANIFNNRKTPSIRRALTALSKYMVDHRVPEEIRDVVLKLADY